MPNKEVVSGKGFTKRRRYRDVDGMNISIKEDFYTNFKEEKDHKQ